MQDLLLGSLPCAFVFNINWRYPVAFKLFFFFGGGGGGGCVELSCHLLFILCIMHLYMGCLLCDGIHGLMETRLFAIELFSFDGQEFLKFY